jgi:isoquinoline 1-oxidoreductase beta subunit
MSGVKKVVQVGDSAVAGRRRIRGGTPRPRSMRCRSSGTKGPNAKVSSETIAEQLKAGLDAPQAFVGNQNGDAKAGLAAACEERSKRCTRTRSRTMPAWRR